MNIFLIGIMLFVYNAKNTYPLLGRVLRALIIRGASFSTSGSYFTSKNTLIAPGSYKMAYKHAKDHDLWLCGAFMSKRRGITTG